jgi:hypothetical protein
MQIFCSSSHWWGTCLTYSHVSTCAGRIFGTAIHSKVDTWTVIEYLVKKKMKSPEPNNVCLCLFNCWVDLLQLLLPTDAIQSTDSSCTLILCQTPIPFKRKTSKITQETFVKHNSVKVKEPTRRTVDCRPSGVMIPWGPIPWQHSWHIVCVKNDSKSAFSLWDDSIHTFAIGSNM